MLLVKDLSRKELEHLYDYTSGPIVDNDDKRFIGMAMFIYSCINDNHSDVDVNQVLNLIETYSIMGDSMMTKISNDVELELTWKIIKLYGLVDDMMLYCRRNIAYPFREVVEVYNILCPRDHHKNISKIKRLQSKYINWYNRLINSNDEIMASVEFIFDYMNYCHTNIPNIDSKIHLIVAFIVINYNLMSLGYQMITPIFNDHKIMTFIELIPESQFYNTYKYRLIMGDYILSGLDVTLSMYHDTMYSN